MWGDRDPLPEPLRSMFCATSMAQISHVYMHVPLRTHAHVHKYTGMVHKCPTSLQEGPPGIGGHDVLRPTAAGLFHLRNCRRVGTRSAKEPHLKGTLREPSVHPLRTERRPPLPPQPPQSLLPHHPLHSHPHPPTASASTQPTCSRAEPASTAAPATLLNLWPMRRAKSLLRRPSPAPGTRPR